MTDDPAEVQAPSPAQDMVVIGGSYVEIVDEPYDRRTIGSGLRAAAVLAHLEVPAVLHTCLDDDSAQEVHSMGSLYRVPEIVAASRPETVTFTYATPLAIPVQSHPQLTEPAVPHLTAQGVVAFGMLEGSWSVDAEYLVVDPQHAMLETSGLAASRARHLALILNMREATRLTGITDATDAARKLLEDHAADVVIVKRGLRGATIVTADATETIPMYPTAQVHPIGSGDAFTAGFAAAWIGQRDTPADAARFASRVAAAYCSTGQPDVDLDEELEPLDTAAIAPPLIYLAGPFFTPGQRWLIRQARSGLKELGVEVFSPFDDIGLGGDEVAAADIEGLNRAHGLLALLDGGDPGTLFEIGWARHLGLPVVALSSEPDSHEWTMLRGTGCDVGSDLPTAVYRAGWAAANFSKGTSADA